MFYNKAKKSAIARLKQSEEEFNALGEEAGDLSVELYNIRKSASESISRVETYINTLANTPKEFLKEVGEVQANIKEFHAAVELEKSNSSHNMKGATAAASGIAAGGAIAALGPTTAMAIATTFGTASTGTAISALSGAAATNAALAWLDADDITKVYDCLAGNQAFLDSVGITINNKP